MPTHACKAGEPGDITLHRNVARGWGDYASETAPTPVGARNRTRREAIQYAINKAIAEAANHHCKPPCMALAVPRIVRVRVSQAVRYGGPGEPWVALGAARWELDIACIRLG